ncbi:MAG TPA: hypothetical protein VMW72_11495 [Sedimentisphaerales bacterium]|nr:hypothetical protein [Sedimentisphaerales bacterium]
MKTAENTVLWGWVFMQEYLYLAEKHNGAFLCHKHLIEKELEAKFGRV